MPQVLVLTDEPSPTIEQVLAELASRGATATRISTRELPILGTVALDLAADRAALASGSTGANAAAATGILDWHTEPPAAPDADPQVARYVEQEWRLALKGLSTITAESIWINHPRRSGWLESNKLEQLRLARAAGLTIPPTLVSNDRDRIRDFAGRWGEPLAVKTQGGVRVEQADGTFRTTYTQVCTAGELMDAPGVGRAPLLVQPYLDKAYELRVSIVDESIFACKIDSQASERSRIDWRRYDFDRVSHVLVDLDDRTAAGLRRLMRSTGLRYAAIDLIVAPDGGTYFLELNPSGQFGWIEQLTGAPITSRLCDALLRGGAPAPDGA